MDGWLIRTVMSLYTEPCTIVRIDPGLSERWFASRDSTESTVVCCCHGGEKWSAFELLYADDIVLMAPTMEPFGRRVAEWRASLLDKGFKVNAGKSKVMVGSSGWKMIVNSGKWCL